MSERHSDLTDAMNAVAPGKSAAIGFEGLAPAIEVHAVAPPERFTISWQEISTHSAELTMEEAAEMHGITVEEFAEKFKNENDELYELNWEDRLAKISDDSFDFLTREGIEIN